MRSRWMVGGVATVVFILAGTAVTKAQRRTQFVALAIATQDQKTEVPRWKGRAEPEKVGESPPPPPDLPQTEPPAPAPSGEVTVPPREAPAGANIVEDPMGAVEAFLRRNRQEAAGSIEALTREAESLRARLQKVEAALARWQTVAGALNAEVVPTSADASNPEPQLEATTKGASPPEEAAKVVPPPTVEPPPPSLPDPK